MDIQARLLSYIESQEPPIQASYRQSLASWDQADFAKAEAYLEPLEKILGTDMALGSILGDIRTDFPNITFNLFLETYYKEIEERLLDFANKQNLLDDLKHPVIKKLRELLSKEEITN